MNAEAQLSFESRVRTREMVIAVVAGVLLVAAAAVQLGGAHTRVDELTIDLMVANQRFPLDLIASIINAVASLAIAWSLNYLFRCSSARSPEVRSYTRWIVITGGVLSAVTGVIYAIIVAIKVHQFVTTGQQTYAEANHLTSTSLLLILQLVGQLAALLLAVGFVLVSLNAMRHGLLTRVMGYLGIFAGVLVLFQITQIPIVQGVWLVALGYLFSGRWPNGLPPAWSTGLSQPWPPSSLAGKSMTERSPRRGARAPDPQPAPAGAGASMPARTRTSTPKRKRKRRN